MPLEYRPSDPGVVSDPFPYYQRMRDEDPCHWSPALKARVLTRYEDVKRVCLDTAAMSSDRLRPFFATLPSAERARIAQLMRYLTLWMVFRDPPEHTRLRRLAAKVFNVRSINALRPQIEALTGRLLEGLDGREELDFIEAFAGPLPAMVIMHMLGVPRGELGRLKRLSDEMALFIGSAREAPGSRTACLLFCAFRASSPACAPTPLWQPLPSRSCCATTARSARRCASRRSRKLCTASGWRRGTACSS